MSSGSSSSSGREFHHNHGLISQLLGTTHHKHYHYEAMSAAKLAWHLRYMEHEQELHREHQHRTRWQRRIKGTLLAAVMLIGFATWLLTLFTEGGHH